jgi:hypothetical protein
MRRSEKAKLPPGLGQATALTARYQDILKDTALKTLAHIKQREAKMAELMLDIALVVRLRMHNASSEEVAAYINQRLVEAGFSIRVSVGE